MQKFCAQTFFLSVFISALVTGHSQVQDAWVVPGIDYIFASTQNPGLVLDNSGNVIAGVNTNDFGPGNGLEPTFQISKYTPAGTKVFEVLESIPESYHKHLVGMAVDNAGNIYCAVSETRSIDPGSGTSGGLFAVYKYSPAGSVVWKRSYGDGQLNIPTAMAIDAAGNVYLTGLSNLSGAQITEELPDYLTVKWNSAGTFQWARKYDGASPGEGYNVATAIAVDGSGNVYITGASQRDGQIGYGTVKYNSAGTLLWDQRYTGLTTGDDRALAITRDISGFVYVTGRSEGAIATIKYNNDGAQIWVQRESSGGAEGRVIKVDGFSNVYVAGKTGTTMALVKYNFAGTKQWLQTGGSALHAMELDASGNIYVTGTANGDGLTRKYSSAGTTLWSKTNDSPLLPGVNDPIAVTANDNVYVISFASFAENGNGNPYYVASLIKYTQCDLVCPQDITINTTPGECTGVVNYQVGITGECSDVIYSQPTGTALPVGTTIVAVVSLSTGEQCSFNVTVNDNEKPVARCRNVTVQLDANGIGTLTTEQVNNGSTDNCGIQSMSLSKTSFNCSDPSSNTVTLTVTDIHGNSSTCTATVTVVDNVPPVANCKSITVYLDASGNVSITPSQVDDGSTDACGIKSLVLSKTSFDCTNKGSNTVTLTVTDNNNNTSTCTATVTVVDNIPPIITAVVSTPQAIWPPDRKMKSVTLSTTSTDNCIVHSCRITGVAIKAGEFANDNIGPDWEITGNNTVNLRAEIPKRGIKRIYTITVTCTDAAGNASSATTDVTVSHNIITPASGASVKIGTTVNLTGEFWDVPGKTHTAKWLIDDKMINGTVTEPSGMNNGTVMGSYKFNAAGVYKLRMNVTDQNGITGYSNTNENLDAIIVVYDPNGGFTYGGGYFVSPVAALTKSPPATGDATYGFTVNYKNASYPKGETQFEFKVGDFEFNALNFDYLVINKAMAQFKGTGKIIGGQSGIGFTMTVSDGQLDGTGVDKIRMKIFNRNTGHVYYDNQPGASDAALPTQTVGANSVVVIQGNSNVPLRGVSNDITAEPEITIAEFNAKVFPNPSNNHFNIVINSNNRTEQMMLQVYDATGKLIETKNNLNTGSLIEIGDAYKPGIYLVRVVQGKNHKELKLVKVSY